MRRLHRCDHPERRKARDVERVEDLRVLDPRSQTPRRREVLFDRFVDVEHTAVRGIADGVGGRLEAGIEEASGWRQLEFVNVAHTYKSDNEDGSFKVGPLNLTLRRGEMCFVIGGNGSGKTSFAKLLLGLYAPEEGAIRLNGQEITDEVRDSYRQLFSSVHADFYLFETLFGLESAELDTAAREYLERLHLSGKLQVKDNVLATTELSQGQRKRLALLTAYLEDRPIYLFDEWAADQDPQFKEIFYFELLGRLKAAGKTAIVISHDDRYYHVADRVIKLNYGLIEFDNSNALTPEDRVLAFEVGVGTKPAA